MAGQLEKVHPDAAEMLLEACGDILAYATFPREHWKKIWSNNPNLPQPCRNPGLVGSMRIEQSEEWMAQIPCYMGRDSIKALFRECVPKTSGAHQPEMAKVA